VNPTAELLIPEVEELVKGQRYGELREALHLVHPADVADVVAALEPKDAAVCFRFLLRDDAAAAFAYLSPESQERLISQLGAEEAVRVVEAMSPDDRVQLLDELPEGVAQRLVASLSPETRKVTQAILGYPPRSVGRLMTPDYVRIRTAWTVAEALDHIRRHGKDAETINVVYVIDNEGRLIDDMRLRALLLADPSATIEHLMNRSFVTLRADQPQEDAVTLMARYDRTALPVVDSRGVLIGIVTADDVADVAERQATEEIQKLGGSQALDEPYMATPLLHLVRKRITWLAALFVGEMFTASAMGYFEHELERTVILSLFVPLIVSSGGNSGSQASSLIIRALALRELALEDWWRVLRRELAAGALMGLGLGVMGLVRIQVWHRLGLANYTAYYEMIGVTLLFSVFGVVLWGCIVGAMLPFFLKRIRLDPATSSAPFVATLVDVTGIVLYLSVAMVALRSTLFAPTPYTQVAMPAGEVRATVVSWLEDAQGEAYVELVVQTPEQKAQGQATRLRVPKAGLPGGVPPEAGAQVIVRLLAHEAESVRPAGE
jgi:magnesium transporter